MAKENKELIAVKEGFFLFEGKKIKYVVLENNAVLIESLSFLDIIRATVNDMTDVKLILYKNSKKKWGHGLYLRQIVEILNKMVDDSANDRLVDRVRKMLSELAYIALKLLTNEQEVIEEEKKEPTFDQLLGALMKVPPPKK